MMMVFSKKTRKKTASLRFSVDHIVYVFVFLPYSVIREVLFATYTRCGGDFALIIIALSNLLMKLT